MKTYNLAWLPEGTSQEHPDRVAIVSARHVSRSNGATRRPFTTDLAAAAAEADLVIEAIPEVLDLKRQVFGELKGAAPEHTIFATNSSTLLPSDL